MIVIVMEERQESSDAYVLPEKWCMQIKGHEEVVKEYLMSIPDFDKNFETEMSGYLLSTPSYRSGKNDYSYMFWGNIIDIRDNFTEITFEQFKKYVLKEEEMKKCKFKVGDKVVGLGKPAISTNGCVCSVFENIDYKRIVGEVDGSTIQLERDSTLWFEDKYFKLAEEQPMEKELI